MQPTAVTAEEKRIYREVAKQAERLSDEALACRANGHSWNTPLTAERQRSKVYVRIACSNGCGCVRQQYLNNWGLVLSSDIDYPKDKPYLMKGVGRLTGFSKGAVRIANVDRIIEKLEKQAAS